MTTRLRRVLLSLTTVGLDCLVMSEPANITYSTGYLSRDSYLVVSARGIRYITDSRYTAEAKKSLKGIAEVVQYHGSLFDAIAGSCQQLGCRKIGFEERYLPYAEHQKIRGYLSSSQKLIPTHSIVERLRQIKDASELATISEAVRITRQGFDCIQEYLQPGIREIEVAAELERFIRYRGARAAAFEIIVASGPNGSYPHHLTGERKLQENEMVTIDMGVDYQGYKSDLTRTFVLGKITTLARKVYDIVKVAQERTIRAISPGVPIASLDRAARGYISRRGYGDYFGHNLGHGVGLEVHESPSLSAKEEGVVEQGMVFTVEPGIYLPGKLGVRMEEMVLVTQKGSQVLRGTLDQ